MTVVNTETGEIASTINYEVHPVAALFPYIEGDAFREFVEDIRVNGQREPVVLDPEGRLLDGRNRARACQALGIDVKETRYSGDDAEAWIISHNVHRRHLTESQRSMIAAKLANLPNGVRSDRADLPSPIGKGSKSTPVTRIRDAAAALNVGASSVSRAKTVLNSGDADLIKSVETGETSVYKAEQQVKATKPAAARRPSAPPRFGPRRKHLHVIDAMTNNLAGVVITAREITELDSTVTREEAARLKGDLSKQIKALRDLNSLLEERSK